MVKHLVLLYILLKSLLNNIISLQIKPKENDNKQLLSLQEENVGLKKKIQTLEHELQSAHKLHNSTKNKLEGELLDLKKKLRDTEAKYSNLAATPPKVSLYKQEIIKVRFKEVLTCIAKASSVWSGVEFTCRKTGYYLV